MARPEEKANAMLNKFLKLKEAGNDSGGRSRRPVLASECDNVDDAERFRRQILREITELVSKIQNPGLGEHSLRDMNDEINKKMREKYHWNKRIKYLGGADFEQMELKQQMENAGSDAQAYLLGSGGYRYYGAAKDLPGVKELFEKQALQRQKKRNRAEIYQRITPDYYGWRDEEDGVLVEVEAEASKKWKAALGIQDGDDDDDTLPEIDYEIEQVSAEQISQALMEQKKKALLSKFSM